MSWECALLKFFEGHLELSDNDHCMPTNAIEVRTVASNPFIFQDA
jgi:hypothetical protein